MKKKSKKIGKRVDTSGWAAFDWVSSAILTNYGHSVQMMGDRRLTKEHRATFETQSDIWCWALDLLDESARRHGRRK